MLKRIQPNLSAEYPWVNINVDLVFYLSIAINITTIIFVIYWSKKKVMDWFTIIILEIFCLVLIYFTKIILKDTSLAILLGSLLINLLIVGKTYSSESRPVRDSFTKSFLDIYQCENFYCLLFLRECPWLQFYPRILPLLDQSL